VNLINGSGLSGTPTLTALGTHALNDGTTLWATDSAGFLADYFATLPPPVLTCTLPSLQSVSELVIWGYAGILNEGKSFLVSFSTNGTSFDSGVMVTQGTLLGTGAARLAFPGGPRLATHVKVEILDNYHTPSTFADRVGLGELRFAFVPPVIVSASSTTFALDTRNYTASTNSTVHTDSTAHVSADTVPGSLRQAISNAPAGGNVVFAPALSGATLTLGGSELTIDKNLTINASALSAGPTVSANNASRVFNITAGNAVTLDSFTVTGGNSASGAGINSQGTVTLNRMTIHGNTATQDGGGIRVSGSATLNNCTVARNSASLTGGGIQTVDAGSLTLNHGTVSANAAPTGGGVHLMGTGPASMTNSIVAGNVGVNISGAITSTGNNISSGDPKLAPLGNYGGLTPTMPPLPGSPAIEGAAFSALGQDQRGNPRPRGPLPDIGAVEAGSLVAGMLADTDNDGIPDVMEGPGGPYPHLTVGINDSGVDTDGDGSTDAAEIGNMTDLNNSVDSFRVLNFALAPGFNALTNPMVSITFSSFPGLNYEVETDNALGTFEPVPGTLLMANGFTQTLIVPLEPGLKSFARVKRR